MKKRTVITNVPTRLPLMSTILYSFLLYYFNVSDIWIGIFITVYSIYWASSVFLIFNQDKIDLEKDYKNISKSKKQSVFRQRLDNAMEKSKRDNDEK